VQIYSSAAAVRFPASHSAFSAANEEHIYYFYVSAAFTPGPPGCQELVVCAYGLVIDSLGHQNTPFFPRQVNSVLPLASLLLLLLFNQQARRNDLSVTPLGRYFRRWSLDEFPQIINLLKGDMRLVSLAPMLRRITSSTAS
jgi:hypothetical protein